MRPCGFGGGDDDGNVEEDGDDENDERRGADQNKAMEGNSFFSVLGFVLCRWKLPSAIAIIRALL